MVPRLAVGAAVAALLSLVPSERPEAREAPRRVSSERPASIRDQLPARVARITRGLEAAKPALGLGSADGFQEYNPIVDESGHTHVRYRQTYRGVEVFNGTVLGHMDAAGAVLAPDATVQKGIDLEPAAMPDEAAIRALVAANLPPGALLVPIRVRPIVFPTRYQDGIKLERDADGGFAIDQVYSVFARRQADAYRWAFLASATQRTENGIASTGFVIDALTGEVLKKWDARQRADTPSVGTGYGQYNGTVELDRSPHRLGPAAAA
jgi:Zn-dependent metalloprotease